MYTRKLTTLLALLTFFVSNFVSGINVPDSLDRGHKLLLEYGLQYQALVFPFSYPAGESFSMSRWEESNFSTPNTHETASPATFGSAPGIYWSRWMNWADCEGSMNLQDWERDYIPTLVALQAGDEKDFGGSGVVNTMRDCFAHWRTNYPRAIAYTSQHGWDGANVAQHQAYQATALPDMVNMFVYEYKDGNGVTGCTQYKWYRALGKYRHIGLLGNDGTGNRPIPSSCFYQSFIHEGNRHIGLSELSVCQYAPLLFGYKFTIAFFYNDPTTDESSLEEELFDSDGDKDPNNHFYQAAANNLKIKKLGPALVRLISTKDNCYVIPGSAGIVPDYCASWNSSIDPYITSISQNNPGTRNGGNDGDVWVGYFNPLHESFDGAAYNNELYFMILNGLAQVDGFPDEAMQQITLNFDFGTSGITSLLRLNRTTGKTEVVNLTHVSGNQYTITLEINGGAADLFKFNNGAPFVGYIDIPENVFIAKFSGYDKPFDLTASEFFSPLGYNFSASQWQISTASSFSTVKWDSGATDAENNVTVPINIISGGTHYGRVRYQNSAGLWSDWSEAKLLDFSSHTIAYWRFEDGVNGQKHNGDQDDWYKDISGNGNHLASWWDGARPTATDSLPFSVVPQFKTENKLGLDFVPNQDICSFGGKPINSYSFTDGWTVECSVKFKSFSQWHWQVPIAKAGQKDDVSGWTGDDPPFSIKICGDTNWVGVYQKPFLNFIDNNGNIRWIWGNDVLTVGKWYQFAATYDNSTAKFYIKSETDDEYVLHNSISVPDGANFEQWNNEWCVGRGVWNGGAADFVDAVIDEVRVSDVALDSSYFLGTENKKLPLLYLTNNNVTVNYGISDYTIGGTNNTKVVGLMKWANSGTGGSGTRSAETSWTISGIPLEVGDNTISVSGKNVYGAEISDSVTITREIPEPCLFIIYYLSFFIYYFTRR
ncbi:LamG domain-containing protein [bacterium]|nr:LamG domain-containing protein [bacterium]